MYERAGAEIAADYRDIMRKLHAVEVSSYEEPKDLPQFEESDALDELIRITSQEDQNDSLDCKGSYTPRGAFSEPLRGVRRY